MVSAMWVRLCSALSLVLLLSTGAAVHSADGARAERRDRAALAAYVYDGDGAVADSGESPERLRDEPGSRSDHMPDVATAFKCDDASQLAHPSGRPEGYGSAPNTAVRGATGSADELLSNVNVSGPYRRPSTGTTSSQRAGVQGQPCHTCGGGGGVDDVMRADHFDPYYERYLRGDTTYAGALDDAAVGPQCMVCSAQQGASYSQVSRTFNRSLYNMFRWMSGGM